LTTIETAFLEYSRRLLLTEHYPRIVASVCRMDDNDIWWRPNEASNSVGNLVLHLAGNVRQWIVSGVGGQEDDRRRQEEFDLRDRIATADLLERLDAVVREAAAVIERLDHATLLDDRVIQGNRVTVLEAIYHVVEHFSMHTGQIVYIAKQRTGADLGFYEIVDGLPVKTWKAE